MKGGFQIISPVDGSIYAERKYATEKEIRTVLERSTRAFQRWRSTPIEDRAEACGRVVDYFRKHARKLGEELTMMMGRPSRYAHLEPQVGFPERAKHMINAAFAALEDQEIRSEDSEIRRFIRREPLGPVLVLAPWNFPYLTSVNALIPAIMAGNTVVLKHAEQTALCAERYAEAFDEAGLPANVFQFVHAGHSQVAGMIRETAFAHVAFTGSVQGGKAVQQAANERFINVGLELGGKDPAYVCRDADVGITIDNLADGAFFNSGQSCCGIKRIYVHDSVYDDFLHKFLQKAQANILGDPRGNQTTMGPVVRKSNAAHIVEQTAEAVAQGARMMIAPGDFPEMDLPYLAPQILVNVDQQMQAMQDEIFGPVVCVMPVKNDKQAIEYMNDSKYGLTASIWTTDPEKALSIGEQVETGTWFMNRCDYLDPGLAWTGVKNSGRGVTLSAIGYEYLTRPKSFHMKIS